jgi:hypothetical protein
MIYAYLIAKYEAAQAASAIRSIKDKAGANLRKNDDYWSAYVKAKADARLALTKVALFKTYAESIGEPFKETILSELPDKKCFFNAIFDRKRNRIHAPRNMTPRAYRSIIKTQNGIKNNPSSYKDIVALATAWAEGRKNVKAS